jgi:hypothetical protein
MKKINVYALVLAAGCLLSCSDGQDGHVYSSWDSMEADKFASAWLIKRFVDPDAEFRFYPTGSVIPEGIPFDTPEAEIRRYHNKATFEYVLEKYGLDDEYLQHMGRLMHEVELISWQRELTPEARGVDRAIKGIIGTSASIEECLETCLGFFDAYYDSLEAADRAG